MRQRVASLIVFWIGLLLTNQFVCVAQQETPQDETVVTRGAFFASRPQRAGESRQQKSQNKQSGAATAGRSKQSSNTNKSKSLPSSATTASKNTPASKNKSVAPETGENPPPQNNSTASSSSTPMSSTAEGATITKAAAVSSDAIGLGYTLYLKDASGGAVRVETNREFTAGDEIRIALETNTDGYLYVFHTEDGSSPQMLYPHARLNAGDNLVAAHTLKQVPPSLNDWFAFDARPAVERLYVVVSRRPLEGVLAGSDLVKYCAARGEDCFWKPSASVWAQIDRETTTGRVLLAKLDENIGTTQTAVEGAALTRGIKLSKSDPAPSIIKMNASPGSSMLVTTIDLVHK